MDTKKRQLNKFAFLFLFLLVLSIGIFNYLVDPFALFSPWTYADKPFRLGYEREFINIKFKLRKKNKYDAVILGGSAALGSFYPETIYGVTLKDQVEILTFEGPSVDDLIYFTMLFVTLHPEVKKVYFAVEYNTLYFGEPEKTIDDYNGDTFIPSELAKMFFSIDTTKSSFKQFLLNYENGKWNKLLGNKDKKKEAGEKRESDKYYISTTCPRIRVDYGEKKIKESDIRKLIELSDFLKKRGVEGVFFIPAYHSLHLANMYYDSRTTEIENFKKKLAKTVNLYDFSYSSYYTRLPLAQKNRERVLIHTFNDPSHPSISLGKIMFERMNNKRKDFGLVLTNDNADSILKYERAELQEYIVNNKQIVDRYMQYSTDPSSSDWAYVVDVLWKPVDK